MHRSNLSITRAPVHVILCLSPTTAMPITNERKGRLLRGLVYTPGVPP